MERYEKRRKKRKSSLINRIIFLLNIIVLIVNIVLVVKIYSKDQVAEASAGEKESTIKAEADGTKDDIIDKDSEERYIEAGREDFSWTYDSTDVKKIIDLEYMSQKDYPTGCESVTTWMALNYMGYDISVDRFIDNYIDTFTISWGENIMFGEDPNKYFIGDPRTANSFGCYSPVIKKALTAYAGENAVHDLSGMSIDEMIDEYVSKGIPVILWATMDMVQSIEGRTWYIERTGETYTWIGKEHCLLLAGWDNDKYYFYDPLEEHGLIAYEKELVSKRYAELGKQALALVKVNQTSDDEVNASIGE